MILQALKQYYDRKAADPDSGIAPLGWEKKEIPFLVVLEENGIPVSIEDTRELAGKKLRAKSFLVPQSVKRAMGIASNFLWDNVEYAIGAVCKGKPERVLRQHEAFLSLIQSHGKIPEVRTVLSFLKRDDRETLLSAFPEWKEMRETCAFLSFKLSGAREPVFRAAEVAEVVGREAGGEEGKSERGVCFVSGDSDEIARLHPAIKGVQGANTTGGNIVSFNFAAAESFGKKQGANAQVGQGATFAYTTALNTLLGKDSKQKLQVGDATTVFWSEKVDPFEENFGSFLAEPPADNPDQLTEAVASLYRSVETGAMTDGSNKTRFYVLGLSPNSARISVRFWHVGTVSEIETNFRRYFEDLRIIHHPDYKDDLPIRWLLRALVRKPQDVREWDKKIPPNVAGETMRCILAGLPFPETLLQVAVLRVKAGRDVTYPLAKVIKACLNRKLSQCNSNNERSLAVSLDKENTNPGYRLGRLFATLDLCQRKAQPGGKDMKTIRDRFYSSASSSPVSVFANLMRLNTHHLAKMSGGSRKYFSDLIGEILYKDKESSGLKAFPAHLSLNDQGQFAIGYYHQMQDVCTRKPEKENA